jgi:hypothetical protein
MRELERRENAAIADRDFGMAKLSHKMEAWVIVLIGLELLLALIGLWYTWSEGEKQQTLLTKMQSNSQATAETLKILSDDQKTSLQRQSETNTNLQNSLTQTSTMVTVLQRQLKAQLESVKRNEETNAVVAEQLKILKAEQAERIAEQNQRPELELWVQDFDLKTGLHPIKVEFLRPPLILLPRSSTSPLITVEFYVRNVGNVTAANITFAPRTPAGVVVECTEFSSSGLYSSTEKNYAPCTIPPGPISPILPSPKDRPLNADDFAGRVFNPAFDLIYETAAAVHLSVPAEMKTFDLEVVLTADHIVPARYRVQCQVLR